MKHFKTTKLFYDQFLYKLVVVNPVAFIFRNKRLGYVRQIIDSVQRQYDDNEDPLIVYNGSRMYHINKETFFELKRFYSLFNNPTEHFKLRVERTYLTIYSNDIDWLKLVKSQSENPKELWQPPAGAEQYYEPNVILVNKPPEYEYKVTFPVGRKIDPGFANWIRANPDKAKTTEDVLSRIEKNYLLHGHYFYIRDEKILQLVMFMIDKVGRIDKLVYVDDQDK